LTYRHGIFDAMFGVKNLLNFIPAINYHTPACKPSVEGGNAEVGQLITGTKFASFLKPCLASENFQIS